MGDDLTDLQIQERDIARIAGQILPCYEDIFGVDCTVEKLYFSENRTCLVRDRGGQIRAVLRLSRPHYHTLEELEAEAAWLCRLREDTRLTLREPVAGADGKCIHAVSGGEDGIVYGTMFSYLTGTLLENLALPAQRPWFERIGEAAAVLHAHVRGWEGSRRLPRFRWDYENTLGARALWGDWRRVPGLTRADRLVLERADGKIRAGLAAYGITEENYGLIHSDLRGANLLTEDGRLKILDFDDCGYGWFMQDLAGSLSFVETDPCAPRLAEAWLAGYRRRASLRRQDIGMIPTFVMMRRLQLTAWVASRGVSDAVRGIGGDFTAGTVALAKRYVQQ